MVRSTSRELSLKAGKSFLKEGDKKKIFRMVILVVPWLAGAYVGPVGLAFALAFDLSFLLFED